MGRKLVEPDAAVARIAARQHGVVTLAQLRYTGLGETAVRRRVARGRLFRVHRGIYAVGHPGLSDLGRYKAATLACGEGSALSHRSAAEVWGMVEPAGDIVHVTVPVAGGRAVREGLRIHRSPFLIPSLITRRDSIPVTRPGRTLEDLCKSVDPVELRCALRRAEVLGLPLGGFDPPVDQTQSELELRFLRLCRRHRIPAPEAQARLGPCRVDFLWRRERLVVETDGYRYHRGRVAFEADRERDNRLVELGYLVLRFTFRRVVDEPDEVAAIVSAQLGLRNQVVDDLPPRGGGNRSRRR